MLNRCYAVIDLSMLGVSAHSPQPHQPRDPHFGLLLRLETLLTGTRDHPLSISEAMLKTCQEWGLVAGSSAFTNRLSGDLLELPVESESDGQHLVRDWLMASAKGHFIVCNPADMTVSLDGDRILEGHGTATIVTIDLAKAREVIRERNQAAAPLS